MDDNQKRIEDLKDRMDDLKDELDRKEIDFPFGNEVGKAIGSALPDVGASVNGASKITGGMPDTNIPDPTKWPKDMDMASSPFVQSVIDHRDLFTDHELQYLDNNCPDDVVRDKDEGIDEDIAKKIMKELAKEQDEEIQRRNPVEEEFEKWLDRPSWSESKPNYWMSTDDQST